MIYQIVLNNGNVINGWSDDIYSIKQMIVSEKFMYTIQENEHVNMTTYILKEEETIEFYRNAIQNIYDDNCFVNY